MSAIAQIKKYIPPPRPAVWSRRLEKSRLRCSSSAGDRRKSWFALRRKFPRWCGAFARDVGNLVKIMEHLTPGEPKGLAQIYTKFMTSANRNDCHPLAAVLSGSVTTASGGIRAKRSSAKFHE